MPDKKLTDVTDNKVGKITDNEIVKALACCGIIGNSCSISCPEISNGIVAENACRRELIISALNLINRLQARIGIYETCNARKDEAIKHLEAENERLKEDIAILDSKNSVKDKLLAKAEAKMESMQMDKEQLESDIVNARMNLEQMRKLYEERADLCEEQERQLLELDFILANYPYMVHFGNGTVCTENHREYERLLASISANAVNEVLEELKNTLVINNEGNTEIFDYEYTLETIEGLKNKGVIFNV